MAVADMAFTERTQNMERSMLNNCENTSCITSEAEPNCSISCALADPRCDERKTTNKQTTSYQLPATSYQLPTTDNRQPRTENSTNSTNNTNRRLTPRVPCVFVVRLLVSDSSG